MINLRTDVVAERVRQEIVERSLRGYEIDGLLKQWEQSQTDYASLIKVYERVKTLPLRSDWPYHEPSDLEGIRNVRPGPAELPPFYLVEDEIRQKIHGAWLGRAVGCVLGKPFEMDLTQEQIKAYLEGANAYPLSDYVPAQSRNGKPLRRDCVPSMRGYVQYAKEDDDLNYMCLAVKLLERSGPNFTTLDVGLNWLQSIPFLWTWGPEHVVYLNLAAAVGEHQPKDIDLERIADYLNPGVEWIGAQIRTDVYGYVCPGNPELAAELAWRDAYLSHRQNGIYGSMWVSAMNAAAFSLLDMKSILYAGLAQIPKGSRFTEAIQQVIQWQQQGAEWQQTGRHIRDHFGKYGFPGTINNACCVAAALLYGWGDGSGTPAQIFERAITIAVQLGYDTDCNAATVGSIIGLMLGAALLPEKWTAALNDTLRTCVAEFGQVSIREMGRRTYEISRIIRFCYQANKP